MNYEEQLNKLFSDCADLAACLISHRPGFRKSIDVNFCPSRAATIAWQARPEEPLSHYTAYGSSLMSALENLKGELKEECEGRMEKMNSILGVK